MKVLICNERLIFRYGVDRILLTLGGALVAQGHEVVFACLRHAPEVQARFGSAVRTIDEAVGKGIMEAELSAIEALEVMFNQGREAGKGFDVAISGGWPFFGVAGLGKRLSVPTVFIDAGAVPHDGMNENEVNVQRAVRRLRASSLPHFSTVLPISEFIRNSQTLPERGSTAGVEVVRLGVDHLLDDLFTVSAEIGGKEAELLGELRRLTADGVPLVLGLGRFEPTGYKNSRAQLDVLEQLSATHPSVQLLLLGEEGSVPVPKPLNGRVRMLGFPSDRTLAKIMSLATLGVSTSLWEGFNLPIGEMQFAGRPVVAFNIGAHSEVIAHPWYLCNSVAEMAVKAGRLIDGDVPSPVKTPQQGNIDPSFSWAAATDRYMTILRQMIDDGRVDEIVEQSQLLLVDMSNCSRDPANTGVTRVARQLTARLQQLQDFDILFLWWDTEAHCFQLLDPYRSQLLSGHGGPRDGWASMCSGMRRSVDVSELIQHSLRSRGRKPILFLPEIAMDGQAAQRVEWARTAGYSVAAVLYDLIPCNHSEYCDPDIVEMFPAYLNAMAKTDLLLAISQTTCSDFIDYTKRHNISTNVTVTSSWLPGQFSRFPRRFMGSEASSRPIQITCISTIEPRKNHKTLIDGFQLLCAAHPELDVGLTLIGNRYAGSPELAAYIEEVCARDSRVRWLGPVSDEVIARELERSRFAVYSSLVEGFGLPILESLWMGRPCLCHNDGVMAELAKEGGCVTVDMRNPDAIASGMFMMLRDDALMSRLQREGMQRKISTWSDYALEIADHLSRLS